MFAATLYHSMQCTHVCVCVFVRDQLATANYAAAAFCGTSAGPIPLWEILNNIWNYDGWLNEPKDKRSEESELLTSASQVTAGYVMRKFNAAQLTCSWQANELRKLIINII